MPRDYLTVADVLGMQIVLMQRYGGAPGVRDPGALEAALLLARTEGIIPALESAHALAWLEKREAKPHEVVVVCLSGGGDKDMATYVEYMDKL